MVRGTDDAVTLRQSAGRPRLLGAGGADALLARDALLLTGRLRDLPNWLSLPRTASRAVPHRPRHRAAPGRAPRAALAGRGSRSRRADGEPHARTLHARAGADEDRPQPSHASTARQVVAVTRRASCAAGGGADVRTGVHDGSRRIAPRRERHVVVPADPPSARSTEATIPRSAAHLRDVGARGRRGSRRRQSRPRSYVDRDDC